jgi:hypothetical protein
MTKTDMNAIVQTIFEPDSRVLAYHIKLSTNILQLNHIDLD